MVIASWLEETLEKRKQRQIMAAANKARTEGEQAVQQRWVDWNRRRQAAFATGEEFSEPPPGENATEGEPGSEEK